jgi:hypothetical protein
VVLGKGCLVVLRGPIRISRKGGGGEEGGPAINSNQSYKWGIIEGYLHKTQKLFEFVNFVKKSYELEGIVIHYLFFPKITSYKVW